MVDQVTEIREQKVQYIFSSDAFYTNDTYTLQEKNY